MRAEEKNRSSKTRTRSRGSSAAGLRSEATSVERDKPATSSVSAARRLSQPTRNMQRVYKEVVDFLPKGFEARVSDLGVYVGTYDPTDNGHWYGCRVEEADPMDVAATVVRVREFFEREPRM